MVLLELLDICHTGLLQFGQPYAEVVVPAPSTKYEHENVA